MAICVWACSREDPAKIYQSARDQYRVGRFTEAGKQAQAEYSRYRKTQSEWRWKFGLLAAEIELLNGTTQRADAFLRDVPPARFSSLHARYEALRGYSLYRHGGGDAEGLLKRAIADAQASADTETEADAWLYLGTSRLRTDLAKADQAYESAEELAGANGLAYQQAAALLSRGFIQIRRERFADAIPLLEEARALADRAGAGALNTSASYNLASCYESVGNLEQALAVLEARVAQQKRSGLATLLSIGYSELGVIRWRQGEIGDATRYFREAFDSVSKDAPSQYSNAAGNLASILDQTGSLNEAEHFNQIAIGSADKADKLTLASLKSTQADIAERRGQHEQAITIYQDALSLGDGSPSTLWQAYAGLARVYSAKGDFATAAQNYADALAVISSSQADQLKSDYKITFLSNLIRFYQDYVALLIQHGEGNRALEIADSSRASVLTEDVLHASAATRTGLLSQVQRAAKVSHSVFLFYWLAPKNSYVWAVTGTESRAVPLADEKQIQQDVDSYRALIEETKGNPLSPTPNASGLRLYKELVGPVAALTPAGSRVIIVPDGALHNLNFETLLVSTPQPHYWIEDATISIAPSLSILRAGKSAGPAHRSLLAMGDPVNKDYPPLPEAKLEIANIQSRFPAADSKIYTGPAAVVDAYAAAQPEKFSNIHFATHVDARDQSPLDSAIILSPQGGRFSLYARDIAQRPLTADLVTISGCRSAGARTLSGEGLVGFAWAFFQAHAQNVVTSLWDVSDNSTAQLMDDFYAGITKGQSYADALREAKRRMLNTKQPYYWAPFQLYSRTIAAARQ